MRKYIGRLYVDYIFFNIWAISLTCVAVASAIFKFTGFEEVFGVDLYIILWIILGLVFLNHVIVVMLRDKYEYNTFFEITDEYFKLASTLIYTFFKLEKVAPLRNILDYTIKQNVISKKFNIYKISINTGSEKLGFYVSRKDVEQLEKLLLTILENNLNYRRYKDE
ncbi:hypothetical protein [Gemella haemolysans]|uniref:hypothetical protein n=1 Tax=Gemella haemolysans TaxID=1379 RepID=UPI00195C1141|nr:hypothetical protein [Gemella haemolysans]VTX79251.1 Uncharacterised protein [Gemella haemolysans]